MGLRTVWDKCEAKVTSYHVISMLVSLLRSLPLMMETHRIMNTHKIQCLDGYDGRFLQNWLE
jgi:hypothetical protein